MKNSFKFCSKGNAAELQEGPLPTAGGSSPVPHDFCQAAPCSQSGKQPLLLPTGVIKAPMETWLIMPIKILFTLGLHCQAQALCLWKSGQISKQLCLKTTKHVHYHITFFPSVLSLYSVKYALGFDIYLPKCIKQQYRIFSTQKVAHYFQFIFPSKKKQPLYLFLVPFSNLA